MNYKQMIIVAIAAAIIGATFLFPPWITLKLPDTGPQHILLTHSERRLFNNPPATSDVKEPYIAWRYPVQEGVLTAVVAGGLCFFLRTRKRQESIEPGDSPSSAAAF